VLVIGAAWWWKSRRKSADDQVQTMARAELFEDREIGLMLHYPSMASVNFGLFPFVTCGEARRQDGPRWFVRLRPIKGEKKPPDWVEAERSLGSRIESLPALHLSTSCA
jgi:hypothetical protein